MDKGITYIGLDVHKDTIAVALATEGRGEVCAHGQISNGTARRMLVEAAWSYRFPARISREQLLRQESLPKPIRDTAWKAQVRLCSRYRKLSRAGKPATVLSDQF